MSQTSYSINQHVGVVGQIADLSNRDTRSFVATETIPFGQFVTRVSGSDSKGKLPALASDITTVTSVAGVALADQARESKNDVLSANYSLNDMVSVMRSGRVYVKVEEAVTPDSAVYVRYAGKPQIQTLVFSGALVTGNVVDGELNGAAITSVPFNTDNATTLSDLAAEIQLNAYVETAVSNGTDTITITSVVDQEVAVTNFVVTGGASQATALVTETQSLIASTDKGRFRASADSSTAALLANAKYRTSSAANELAVLEVQL